MRTTEEWFTYFASDEVKAELMSASNLGDEAFFKFMCDKIQDEAVAHGMTLAAEITQKSEHQDEDAWMISDPINGDILIARDNNVWRKE